MVLRFLLCFLAMAAPGVGAAWQRLQPEYGTGYALCAADAAGHDCLALQCHPERGLEFARYAPAPDPVGLSVLSVDGGPETVLRWRDVGTPGLRVQNYDAFSHNALLVALGRGGVLEMRGATVRRFDVPEGAAAIDEVLAACAGRTPHASLAEIAAAAAEAEGRISPRDTALSYLQETDSWGNDLDGGLTNPALSGIAERDCIAACLGRADCRLATYNTARRVCFLKSGFGALKRDPNARTTLIARRPTEALSPALPGPAAVTTDTIRASPLIPWQETVEAIRAASEPLGGSCKAEMAEVRRVAGTVRAKPLPESGVAGAPAAFEWDSDALTQRIPLWIVLSADRPVRFEGDGFYGLNRGAIGPFGLTLDADRQRAFAPLYTRENLTGGRIGVLPLEAGAYEMRVTLVAYLRACRQEVPLIQTGWTLTAAPAPPRIVLRDITEAYPYERRIEVPEFGRRIELTDTRFQIQHLSDGSEVLAREGKELRLSPTKRFVAIHDNREYEIIDIVDGETVARVDGESLAFWNGDSFFLTDSGPWGEMWVGATMRPRVFVEGARTGGSCCQNGGNTLLVADLENNLVMLHDQTASLFDGTSLGIPTAPAYAASGPHMLGSTFGPQALAVIDTVAPAYDGSKWSLPLGPFIVHGTPDFNVYAEDNPEHALILQMATGEPEAAGNPDFGKAQEQMAGTSSTAILRGASVSAFARTGFIQAMERVGVSLVPGEVPRTWLKIDRGEYEPNDLTAAQERAFNVAVAQIEADVRAAGKTVDWAVYVKDPDMIGQYCDHFPGGKNGDSVDVNRMSAHELDLAFRFESRDRRIWVTRATCLGGTLGSNLVNMSELNIFDSQGAAPSHANYRADSFDTWGTNVARGIFETGFEAKLFYDRYVVTYAPGEGAIMVFDLTTREFLMKLRYARRGDLLEDVFMDAEARHLYQLNSNGSFTVYRLADGAAILEGRYLDDEIVIWTASFHFDSTEEGAAFVELRFPGTPGQYSFQQFGNALRVPGLMRRVIDGSIELPEVAIGRPPRIEGRIGARGDRLDGLVRVATDAGLRNVSVFQDGVLTDRLPATPGEVLRLSANRLPGTRWVSVVAEDDGGLLSLPLNTDLGAPERPRVHFFGVGIDYYASDALTPLNYAKRDTITMLETLKALDGSALTVASETVLMDRRATGEAILGALRERVAAAETGDHLVLFFAGHGLRDAGGAFYLGLSATDLSELGATALAWGALAEELRRRDIRVTVLLDACHAGAAETDAFATNDGAVEALVSATNANVTVIAAAKGRQFSGESAEVGGGYFTAAIRTVLLENRARFDQNGNGALEAVEFYRGVKAEVTALRGGDQTPWMVRNRVVGEYALF
jgi:hypothetical protein